MRNRGDSDEVVMTQFIGGQSLQKSYLHADTDGVGALYRNFSEQGLQDIQIKGLGSSQKIPALKRFTHFLSAFKKIKAHAVHWPLREIPLDKSPFFYLLFSEQETAALQNYCKNKKINLRVLLLFHFHSYFNKWLATPCKQGSWLLPVSIRRPDQASTYENLASYFILPISEDENIEAVNEKFRREIKSGAYWGNYWLLVLFSLLGRRFVYWIGKQNARRGSYMGTISDIGEWSFTHPQKDLQEQLWASAPPASTPYPIGVSKLIINGKMSVGIRINRRIKTPDHAEIEADLRRLKSKLLEMT